MDSNEYSLFFIPEDKIKRILFVGFLKGTLHLFLVVK